MLPSGCFAQIRDPEGMLTVKTVAETGTLIEGARVVISSDVYLKNKIEQITTQEGAASGTLRNSGLLYFAAGKMGHYSASGQYQFNLNAVKGPPETWVTKRWEPWNPTVEVVLKEKGPQLPMYAKRIQTIELPDTGKDIGYDFELGHWVAPHGKGKTVDLIFTGSGEVANGSYRLRWTFSDRGDGIRLVPFDQGARSELKSPKEAPVEGYAPALEINSEGRVVAGGRLGERPACFLLRVRTVLDENGKVVSAHYGKIYPD